MFNKQEYNKNYIKNSIIIICPLCNSKYKKAYQSIHKKSKCHIMINKFLISFNSNINV
jgi:hypothetical protein